MTLHEQLARETAADRDFLLAAPVIRRCLAGEVTRELYVAFLTQAWHHVRHTVPLLMAVGSRLPDRHAWLRDAVLHYLEEETGHDEWVLNDIEAAGGDRGGGRRVAAGGRDRGDDRLRVRHRDAPQSRRLLRHGARAGGHQRLARAHAADRIQSGARPCRRGRSRTCAATANSTRSTSTTWRGSSSVSTDGEDRRAVIRCAKGIYWLYGHVFRSLEAVGAPAAGGINEENGMNPASIRALVTGGAGGIGGAIASELLERGALA